MDTKYNNNIICQIEMIDTRKSYEYTKGLPFFKQFLKHGAHLKYVFYPCMEL